MRPNKYCYILQLDEDRHIVFNGLNKRFILLNNEMVSSYESILSEPNKYLYTHSNIINELKEGLFIVDDEFNELVEVKKDRYEYVNSPVFKTSIIPTFECNYKCWYCTQNHRPLDPNEIKLDKVVRHIEKYLIENNIEEYILSWFGGEPLTQPESIKSVSVELMNFCKKHDICYYGAITTNGALLDRDIILMLKQCGINEYQIAIDGDRESHNKNKYDEHHASSFNLILSNIVMLAQLNEEAVITLRLNHKPQDIEDVHLVNEINAIIPYSLRNRITIDLQRIWQIDERRYDLVKLNNIGREFVSSGYRLSTSHIFSMCYVEKKHYNTYYYSGQVEKCDQKSMDNLRGFIDENGDLVWRSEPLFPQFDVLGKDSDCLECEFYPICYCGCPVKREDSIEKKGRVVCGFGGDFSKLEHRIKDYCLRVLNNTSFGNPNI